MNQQLAGIGVREQMRRLNLIRLISIGAICAVVSGCQTPHPPAPTTAAQSEYEYRLGPGDTISIMVWRNPELSAEIPVRPDGRITAPLVNDLVAAGKTPTELSKELANLLQEFVRKPAVSVLVTNFVGSSLEQVRVVGQATTPTALPYKHHMSLLDVMIAVGGITEYAAGNSAVLIRKTADGKQATYSLRLTDLIQGGDVGANIEMLPGDVVMIPEARF